MTTNFIGTGSRSAAAIVQRWESTAEIIPLRASPDWRADEENLLGGSAALLAVRERVAKVAPTGSTVLITGETGTGKELVARAIHRQSARAARPLVSVNCAATPATLIASELFGHEKGSFTGAVQRRLGRFELANGGTLFLDEVGDLPLETQIALLRVLQEQEFERVGGTAAIRADVRIVAATNRDLETAISAGTFRRDLYYRLNVFPIEVPALRERRQDIRELVEYFVARSAARVGKTLRHIQRSTLDQLEAYEWPGNIRELQNVIERSVIVSDSEVFSIDSSCLPQTVASRPSPATMFTHVSPPTSELKSRETGPSYAALKDIEREAIVGALRATNWIVGGPKGAAAILGLKRTTLQTRMQKLGIVPVKSAVACDRC